jgi:hypothetical protein
MLSLIVAGLLTIIIFISAVCFYMLPWIIACDRKLKHSTTIFFITMLFGSTGIIWIGCLLWAALSDDIEEE